MKKIIKKLLQKYGYNILPYHPEDLGKHPYRDIEKFVTSNRPTFFDIGANKGQSVRKFQNISKNAIIHSFEPSPEIFRILNKNVGREKGVNVWNYGIGSKSGKLTLFENTCSDMSSFLTLGESGWGEIKKETSVEVITLDNFCQKHNILKIDVLKVDTQGYELEVFKGAEQLINDGKIELIYFEVNFTKIYDNLPTFGELYNFLISRQFSVAAIYPINYRDGKAGWTDILFLNDNYSKL